MKFFDGHPLDQIFTHVDSQGTVRHFNASALLRAIMGKKLAGHTHYQEVALTAEMCDYIIQNQGVELDHLERIPAAATLAPILLCCFEDDTQVLVDGNHRYVRRFRMGCPTIPAIFIDKEGWRPYLIEDVDQHFPLEVAIPFLDKVDHKLLKKG